MNEHPSSDRKSRYQRTTTETGTSQRRDACGPVYRQPIKIICNHAATRSEPSRISNCSLFPGFLPCTVADSLQISIISRISPVHGYAALFPGFLPCTVMQRRIACQSNAELPPNTDISDFARAPPYTSHKHWFRPCTVVHFSQTLGFRPCTVAHISDSLPTSEYHVAPGNVLRQCLRPPCTCLS